MRSFYTAISFLPSALFPAAALLIGLRNRSIFQAPALWKDALILAAVLAIVLVAVLIFARRSNRRSENLAGLLLFGLFATGYFLLASIFNKPDLNTNNIYFAADSWSWLQRMALVDGWQVVTRAVHPLTFLIFRPLVSLLAILTGSDRFAINLAVLALAGGGCVFLMWKIVRLISADQIHAVLFASLLGLSASHLVFASVIETYIFSAFGLLLFIWLLLTRRPAWLLVAAGVLTLGITATNMVQQALTALFVQRNLKRVVVIFAAIVILSAGLNILAHALYPVPYFFLPENIAEERSYLRELSLKRAGLMAENLFIYNVAAPQPYLSLRQEMPRFNFLNGTIREYAWFGWPAPIAWLALLALSFFYFIYSPYAAQAVRHRVHRETMGESSEDSAHSVADGVTPGIKDFRAEPDSRPVALSMLACLLFNLLLHIRYGVEPFLYSADWTYALILFAAIALQSLAGRLWFRIALFALVLAVFVNNLGFLYILARKVSEYLA